MSVIVAAVCMVAMVVSLSCIYGMGQRGKLSERFRHGPDKP